MKILLLLSLAYSPLTLAAGIDVRGAPAPEIYNCQVVVAAEDVNEGGTFTFTVSNSDESHGGPSTDFTVGNHTISVMANRQWLGLSWMKSGKKIAEGVFVLGAGEKAANRVAILYDPTDSGDQVSLGCDLVSK